MLTHFIQDRGMDMSYFVDFLRVFAMLIWGGFKGSYGSIDNGGRSCFSHGERERLKKVNVFLVLDVPLQLVVIYASFSHSLLIEYRGIIVITLITN